jgi:hypothetical protein
MKFSTFHFSDLLFISKTIQISSEAYRYKEVISGIVCKEKPKKARFLD